MKPHRIPEELKERRQWVLWKTIIREGDKPTKVPFQPNGEHAKTNDAATWSTFDDALANHKNYDGIGYVFADDDPFCGIDLDGCRNPVTGICEEWARQIIRDFNTYAVALHGKPTATTAQQSWALGAIRKPVPDAERFHRVWERVKAYDGAYEMAP